VKGQILATGRDMQLTRQIGEHLVAAELGRRGIVATPFAGNIPEFDLLAANARGAAIPIQVKAIRSASWQFQIQQFLDVQMRGSRQHVSGRKRLTNPDLICIFVQLRDDSNPEDEFYIFTLRELQTHFHSTYKSRVRPRNPNSFHCAIRPQDLKAHKNNWSLIEKKMKSR